MLYTIQFQCRRAAAGDADRQACWALNREELGNPEVSCHAPATRSASPSETTSPAIKVEVASGIMVSFTANDAFDLEQAIKAALEAAKLMKEGQVKGLTLKNIQKASADKAKAS